MADNNKDLISNEVLQKATQDILQTVSEHLYEYTPYTNEEIAEIFDLDEVTSKSLSKVINDEYVAKNKVFSNEHTMELLSKTLAEANQYTTEQIANSGKLERKIVTSTSEVINENILYLILTDSTNNIYTQYMLIDGNATPLGTTQINLNDYLKTISQEKRIQLVLTMLNRFESLTDGKSFEAAVYGFNLDLAKNELNKNNKLHISSFLATEFAKTGEVAVDGIEIHEGIILVSDDKVVKIRLTLEELFSDIC